MMLIENKYNIGDIVYLKTDKDQKPCQVIGILINSLGTLYDVRIGVDVFTFTDIELTNEVNVLAKCD